MPRRELCRTVNNETELPGTVEWLQSFVRQGLQAGPVMVVLTRPRRNLDQNARFHAMLGDIAKQCTFAGRTMSADEWKILFVSGHAVAEGKGADVVPGLEGEFVNLRESTARMTKGRMASLIEYVAAWGAEHSVQWSEQSKRDIGS